MLTGESITAVIPVHNRADLLERLLASIAAQTVPFAEMLVVDNESTDGAPEIARRLGCTVLEMGENSGFARAVNRGWRAARTPWVAVLNSDVELDAGWAERLLAACDGDNSPRFATGKLIDASNRVTLDGTYDLMSRGACAWRAGNGQSASMESTLAPIAIAPATACLFRREVLELLGGFDEAFESYLEDVDLGLRCLREGIRGVYVPDAVAWHKGSATLGRWSPSVVRLISRNQLLLVARHYDYALFRSCLWPIVVGQLLWGLVAFRHGAGLAWLAGKWEGLRGFRPGGQPSARLREFLDASEAELRRRAHDPYWRWYFRLTSLPARRLAPGGAH